MFIDEEQQPAAYNYHQDDDGEDYGKSTAVV
jgi:hypothetical protein